MEIPQPLCDFLFFFFCCPDNFLCCSWKHCLASLHCAPMRTVRFCLLHNAFSAIRSLLSFLLSFSGSPQFLTMRKPSPSKDSRTRTHTHHCITPSSKGLPYPAGLSDPFLCHCSSKLLRWLVWSAVKCHWFPRREYPTVITHCFLSVTCGSRSFPFQPLELTSCRHPPLLGPLLVPWQGQSVALSSSEGDDTWAHARQSICGGSWPTFGVLVGCYSNFWPVNHLSHTREQDILHVGIAIS